MTSHCPSRFWSQMTAASFPRRRGRGRIAMGMFSAFLLFLGVVGGLAAQEEPIPGLDAFVVRVLEDWRAPGLALAVVKDDSVMLARGYGFQELGATDPIDANTLFAVASTTKAFTATALGMLVDEGEIDWDDKVTDLLPGFQLMDPYVTRELTVRDLLSHRSGLPRGDRLWYASPFDREEVVERVRYLEPEWSFRSHYGYQNIMFLTAGELLEAVSGESWDDYLREHIFSPLGMERTTTTTRGLAAKGNVATPHVMVEGEVIPVGWRDFDNVGGAGAINSSVAEMAQWVRLNLRNGVYEGDTLVSEEVIQELRTPQTVIRRSETTREIFPETHFQAYGLGWSLRDYRGRKVVSHGGALDGMRTQVGMIPELDLGVVVVTNLNNSWIPQAVMFQIFDAFMEPREKNWSNVMREVWLESQNRAEEQRQEGEAARVMGTTPSLPLEAYTGIYEDVLYGTAEVWLEDGTLMVEVGPSFVGELEHWNFDTFRARWRDEQLGRSWVEFRLDRSGEVEEVEIEGWRAFHKTEGGR